MTKFLLEDYLCFKFNTKLFNRFGDNQASSIFTEPISDKITNTDLITRDFETAQRKIADLMNRNEWGCERSPEVMNKKRKFHEMSEKNMEIYIKKTEKEENEAKYKYNAHEEILKEKLIDKRVLFSKDRILFIKKSIRDQVKNEQVKKKILDWEKEIPNVFSMKNDLIEIPEFVKEKKDYPSVINVDINRLLAHDLTKIHEKHIELSWDKIKKSICDLENVIQKIPNFTINTHFIDTMDIEDSIIKELENRTHIRCQYKHQLCKEITILYYLTLDRAHRIELIMKPHCEDDLPLRQLKKQLEMCMDQLSVKIKQLKIITDDIKKVEEDQLDLMNLGPILAQIVTSKFELNQMEKKLKELGECEKNKQLKKEIEDKKKKILNLKIEGAQEIGLSVNISSIHNLYKCYNPECNNTDANNFFFTNNSTVCKVCYNEKFNHEIDHRLLREYTTTVKKNRRSILPTCMNNNNNESKYEAAHSNFKSRVKEWLGLGSRCKLKARDLRYIEQIHEEYNDCMKSMPKNMAANVMKEIATKYNISTEKITPLLIRCSDNHFAPPTFDDFFLTKFYDCYIIFYMYYHQLFNRKMMMKNYIYPKIIKEICKTHKLYEKQADYCLSFIPPMETTTISVYESRWDATIKYARTQNVNIFK